MYSGLVRNRPHVPMARISDLEQLSMLKRSHWKFKVPPCRALNRDKHNSAR